MRIFYRYALTACIVIAALANLYFGFQIDYINSVYSESAVLLLMLLCYMTLNAERNICLISILSLFILSNVIEYVDYLSGNQLNFFAYFMGNLAFLGGILLIFFNIIKETSFELIYGNYMWLILTIIGIDAFIMYQLIYLSIQYGLDSSHLFFGSIFVFLKMMLFSVGIIYYLANKNKSRKASFLVITFGFYFLQDLTEVIQYLFFMTNRLSGLGLLQSGFALIALFFLYLFFAMPKGSIDQWK
ncbi:hypothetical protein ACFQ1M_12735 [Sungkyunkwania multivorans]|uniref:YhhN-like protein n=1 Tax=Sungkyunkwania multivorans TaxID=1173618 RepID=A0ABW3D2L9_9FLAO